jgi:type I restriction enzyme S subunit
MSGTSGRQRVSAAALEHFTIAQPQESVARAFGEIAQPLFDLARCNMNESRHLAVLRDYLLPKLLSGAVRVRDAERFAESAL